MRGTAIAAGSVVALDSGIKLLISSIGFTIKGIAANSIAATIHAGIGNVAAGSAFANLQSVGALGCGVFGPALIPVIIIGVVACAGYFIYKYRK
jgi:hypothetical protein